MYWGNEGFETLLGIMLKLEVRAKAKGWMRAPQGQEKILALNSD